MYQQKETVELTKRWLRCTSRFALVGRIYIITREPVYKCQQVVREVNIWWVISYFRVTHRVDSFNPVTSSIGGCNQNTRV